MQEMTLDIAKSKFTINNESYNLFDLPKFITSIKKSLEEDLPASMEIEKEIILAQLSIIKIQSQLLVQKVKNDYQGSGIYLN